MNFDDYVVDEYEEVLPQDKEFKNWMEGIDRDYAKEVANIDVDEELTIHCDDDDEEDEPL